MIAGRDRGVAWGGVAERGGRGVGGGRGWRERGRAMWDPAVYRRYGDERSRPFFELVARVDATDPRTVVDLGCGPGDLTATLAQLRPSARVRGVDSSPEMIAEARAGGGPVEYEVGDVR